MLPIILTLSLHASAATVLALSDRVAETDLVEALELRCPGDASILTAVVTDMNEDAISLQVYDDSSTWHDNWEFKGEDFSDSERSRALSLAICGRFNAREIEQELELKEPQERLLGAHPWLGMAVNFDRPSLGARVDACFGRVCPELGAALRYRPWGQVGRTDHLPEAQAVAEIGIGFEVSEPVAVGLSGFYEGGLEHLGARSTGGALWFESGRQHAVSFRGAVEVAGAVTTSEELQIVDGVEDLITTTQTGTRTTVMVAAVWRGLR